MLLRAELMVSGKAGREQHFDSFLSLPCGRQGLGQCQAEQRSGTQMLKLEGCIGIGCGVRGKNEESGSLGAGQESVCQGVSHKESLGTPELDMKPQLLYPWYLFENMSATSELPSVPLSLQGLLC